VAQRLQERVDAVGGLQPNDRGPRRVARHDPDRCAIDFVEQAAMADISADRRDSS